MLDNMFDIVMKLSLAFFSLVDYNLCKIESDTKLLRYKIWCLQGFNYNSMHGLTTATFGKHACHKFRFRVLFGRKMR